MDYNADPTIQASRFFRGDSLRRIGMKLGKVVKSNSHCDYLVQVSDRFEVTEPPSPDRYGFGSFVRLDPPEGNGFRERSLNNARPTAVGIVYNSQLFNPQFLNTGPRLTSEADPLFTPDLIEETRTLLSVVLIGELLGESHSNPTAHLPYGNQGIPRAIVSINADVYTMNELEIRQFHRDPSGASQFRYHSILLRYGGNFATHLTEQVLQELVGLNIFKNAEQRALSTLCREMSWRNTLGSLS